MSDAVLDRLRQLYSVWKLQQERVIRLYQAGVLPTTEDLRVWLPGCNSVVDHGLGSNSGIFAYKLPDLLIKLWQGTYQDCVGLQNVIIQWQVKQARSGGVIETELAYTMAITNIIAWTLKHKFGCVGKDRRRVTSGDCKPKTHWTVGGNEQ
jgi:hypothetical protein